MKRGRPVVKLDTDGKVVERYLSMRHAAKDNYITAQTVATWVKGKRDLVSVMCRYGFILQFDEEAE